MTKIIDTSTLDTLSLSAWERDQVYNGLDCCLTFEILEATAPLLDNQTRSTYEFSKSLQGPALEMRCRGVRIDEVRRQKVLNDYADLQDLLERQLERIVRQGLGVAGFNHRSNADLQLVFYDALGIPVIRKKGRPTVDRDALERMEEYDAARPILNHMYALRDIEKKMSVLRTEIDPDGRIRTSYNIAGTTTGRWSSSATEFGTGGNLQNVEEGLRSTLVADPGYKFGYFDGEQGESRVVGATVWNLFLDGTYLDACETGDLHTSVAKLCWPELPWPGDPVGDRELAERPYYRHYDRRFMCKKIGHGTNYFGQPRTLATQSKVPVSVVVEFQPKYFAAFPGIVRWHEWTDAELHHTGYLDTITGRRRWFYGRRNDPATFREAIAYGPQGGLGDILNSGLLQVWRARSCTLMMQVHDAILVQFPEEQEDEIVPLILSQLRYPIELRDGRQFEIPYGCATGWNFGKRDKDNPDGLQKYRPSDKRKRSTTVPILDRPVHGGIRRHRKPGPILAVGGDKLPSGGIGA